MTEPCSCPFTAGQLLALGAIATTSRTPGGKHLAEVCFEHAREHHTPEPDDGIGP